MQARLFMLADLVEDKFVDEENDSVSLQSVRTLKTQQDRDNRGQGSREPAGVRRIGRPAGGPQKS
jgi:hypothetical protein